MEDEHDDQHDLEAWQPEHPYEEEEHIDSNVNRGRWTVDEVSFQYFCSILLNYI